MRHALAWIALMLPILLLANEAVAQKEKKDKDADLDKDKDKTQWIKAGTITGKVMAVYEDKRKLRIQVKVPKLNVDAVRDYQNAQRDYNVAIVQRNAQNAVNAQNAMARAQARLYTTENKDVEVQAIEDVVVRDARPREEFDDKGRVKKLTKAELKEQKGPNPKLPGYNAEFSDLQTGQFVSVTIVRKKGQPLVAKPKIKLPRRKGKGDLDPDVADLLEDTTPQVSMIVFENPIVLKLKK